MGINFFFFFFEVQWVFESVKCDCEYSLICNMMMWHVRIGGEKLGFTLHLYRI